MKKVISVVFIVFVMALVFACAPNTSEGTKETVENTVKETVMETVMETTRNVVADTKKPMQKGDMLIETYKGNIVDGFQWRYIIGSDKMALYDDMVNFYDLESKTEIGDFTYFFRAVRPGDVEIKWSLIDTKNNTSYCDIIERFHIDDEKSENGFYTFTLLEIDIKDRRGEDLSAYTYDEPQVTYHMDGNGG